MRDINEPLRVAYGAALTQVPSVDCFYQYLPNTLNPDNYIVFRSINSNDASTKSSARLNMNITIEIHTKGNIGNPGLSADAIADTVFQLCYPNKHVNLSLSRGSILWTRVANDVTQDFRQGNQFGHISRFITFAHCVFVDIEGADGGGTGMVTDGQLFRFEYTGIGGESGFVDLQLRNKRPIAVFKDGIEFSRIITTGLPTDKEVLYTASTGGVLFDIPLEPDEEVAVIYQLNNQFQTLVFDYTATGGETSFTSSSISNKSVYGIMRDGVSASKIRSSGTPVNKEALYEQSTGAVTFASAMEPGEKAKVLYQL